MKTLLIILIALAVAQQTTSAQSKEKTTKYGFSLNEFKSQSGFQMGYDLHFTIQPSYKSKVSFGVFIDNETKEFAGMSINHQWMLFSHNKLRTVQPFIMYNFIYRRTKTHELIATSEGIKTGTNWVNYSSMEHHLGMGLEFNFTNNFFMDCSLGYGLYLGSIKKPSAPNPITNEIMGTSGKGSIFKIGFGFRF